MNITKTFLLLVLAAAVSGCGYSKPAATAATMPAISQLDPPSTTAGGVQFQLEVDGANFSPAAVVNFNGNALATTRVSAAKLEVTIPASAITTSAMVPVTVTNPGTGGIYGTSPTTSTAMTFTIN
jgi:hypothetical protein